MSNNLRIIYKNLANSSTLACSLTPVGVTSLANLKLDSKSLVCRTTGTSVTYTVTLATEAIVGGVVLPFCNLTSQATISVTLSNGNSYSTNACPYQNLGMWDWGAIPLGANTYAYGNNTYARIWFLQQSVTSLTITISDPTNTAGYLEFSRLIVGAYWSPTYNTSFGLSAGTSDLSTNSRSESGDLITNRGTRFSTLNFDLKYMDASDRTQLMSLLKGCGTVSPLLISLFPDNSEDWGKEQTFMVYGKIPQLSDITHPIFGIYSTQIQIEEV